MLGKKLLRDLGVGIGDPVEVRFRIEDPDRVEVPPEIERAVDAAGDLRAAWDALTPGRRRGWSHMVNAAKTERTRTKRIAELVDALRGGPDPFVRR